MMTTTALVIYRSPNELVLIVRKLPQIQGYEGRIYLGSRYRGNRLVTTAVLPNREGVVKVLRCALEQAVEDGRDYYRGQARLRGALTPRKCRQIIAALRTRSTVETFRQEAA